MACLNHSWGHCIHVMMSIESKREKHFKLFQCTVYRRCSAFSVLKSMNFLHFVYLKIWIISIQFMLHVTMYGYYAPKGKTVPVSSFRQNKFYLFSWKVMAEGVYTITTNCEQIETKQWKLKTLKKYRLNWFNKIILVGASDTLYFPIKLRVCYQHLSQLFKDYYYYYYERKRVTSCKLRNNWNWLIEKFIWWS